MNGSIYLQWHYLAFLAPAGASALLLLLSGLRLGGHRSHHHGGASARHVGPAHGARHASGSPAKHGGGASRRNATRSDGTMVHGAVEFLLAMFGFQRVPPLLMLQMFFLCGGLAGFWANRLILGTTEPSFLQWLPCLFIAVAVGAVSARLGAELIARVMPQDATSVVMRDGLIGLTGKVVYAISETTGRVHIYDDFGTLHDENCRIAPGHAPIDKGSFARIVDRDAAGQFLVEEASEPPILLR